MPSGDERTNETLPEGILLSLGNPLLDLQTTVDEAFLEKWGLAKNDAILCDDKHIPMFHELEKNYKIEYIPGGAAQNALRVCQWILNRPNATTFFGAVGADKYGEILREKARSAGVNVQYQVHEKEKTGTCAALIHGMHRSLCAHLAAANTFTADHLEIPEYKALIDKAQFFYMAGFFLTVCPEAVQRIARTAAEKNKPFMFNLAAAYISQYFNEPLKAVMPYVDVLFGNEVEARAFADANGFGTDDLKEIAKKAAAWEKVNSDRSRIVVLTHGDQPTIVVADGVLTEYPVTPLTKEQIVDTNGAGDAFVGGFLAEFIRGRPMDAVMKCGHYAASAIIGQQGCTFPDHCDYH